MAMMSIRRLSSTKVSPQSLCNRITTEPAFRAVPEFSLTYYTEFLEYCIRSKSLCEGKLIHQHLLKTENSHVSYPLILEKLARLYVSCNEIELAQHVFDKIPRPNVDFWNFMIRAYAWSGPCEKAVGLYYKMLQFGTKPNKFTFPFVLKACSALQAFEDGEEIHSHVKKLEIESDIYISTALINFYAKCGNLTEAKLLFDRMYQKDVVAWNAMIAGYSLHAVYDDTIRLFIKMQEGIHPNSSTIVAVLPTVAEAKLLYQGKAIHGFCIRRSFSDHAVVATGLLDMYAKCQCILYASRIFGQIDVRNEVTWSAIIGAYVTCGLIKQALQIYDQMRAEDFKLTSVTLGIVIRACAKLSDLDKGRGIHCLAFKSGFILDIMVGNTLLSMYAKCGIIDDTFRFFEDMKLKDTVSYSAIISGCSQNGYGLEALCIFHDMQLSKVEPDMATMRSVLSTCSHLAAPRHGACGHGYSIVCGYVTDTSTCNALIDMYSKCGQVDVARKVFDRMEKQDTVTWNTMIDGYGIHGLGAEALSLFNDHVSHLKPDDVTFICLLSACSHAGLVTEGKQLFDFMIEDLNIVPRMDHYICMVDLLGRAGLLDEACNFLKTMPCEPDVRVWGTLLAACRIHKNIEIGEEVSRNLQSLGCEGTGSFVLLSNIYSAVGRWNDAANVRIAQKNQGFKKSPGCSWLEINGVVHAFVGGDRSHPHSAQINKKLNELFVEMTKLGYRAESSFVLQDVEEEEKEHILLYHSEKLAIAFAILNSSPIKPILVTKNLRVCVDCHTAIKFITLITKREITVRDGSRFHHFRDGICNCRDFW